MDHAAVISLSQLSKQYRVYARPSDRLKQMLLGGWRRYYQPFEALRGVSLEVGRGETVGLIGRNGSGKSTLLQIVCGTLSPSAGEVAVRGRISALLELGAGFNPEFSGRENVFLNAAILGLSREETAAKYESIIAFSGLDTAHIEQPVKTYSSGMYVRLAFSVAIAAQPDILIIDEALAVGDEGFQRKCFSRIKEMQEGGATILFVSHSAQSVIELCDRAVLLDEGEKLGEGRPKDVIAGYHRLIYAPREQRPAIREALKQGDWAAPYAPVASAQDATSSSPMPGMNADRIEYAKQGGEITRFGLSDLNGNPVQTLHTGERYRFAYQIRLDEAAPLAKFGMLIKTARGVQLGGAVADALYRAGQTLPAGDIREIVFEFDCPLRPGHYFLNCGFTRMQGEDEVFVHRIIDALEFRVIDPRIQSGIIPAGHIDLNITVQGCA